MKRHLLWSVAVALLLSPAAAEPRTRSLANFGRLVYHRANREDAGRWIGQVSVRELRHPDSGISVVLLALAHTGREEYYRSLTPHLRDAEAVLAEGHAGRLGDRVKDEDLPPDALWHRRSLAACAGLLGLSHQIDWEASVIDKRWVLADLGEGEILEAVRAGSFPFPENGKPVVEGWEALLRGAPSAEELAKAREAAAANVMAKFGELQAAGEPGNFQEKREEALWRAIRERIAPGRLKRIAVVYGAWHLPPIESKLQAEGFRVEATCWHDCVVFEQPSKVNEEKR